jgi:DNA-binding transcriptional regulator YdaS (Cro superfamily)
MSQDLTTITKQAVEAAAKRVGGPTALARDLGITYQALWRWQRVPLAHCHRVAELSKISRKRLRPDVYA